MGFAEAKLKTANQVVGLQECGQPQADNFFDDLREIVKKGNRPVVVRAPRVPTFKN